MVNLSYPHKPNEVYAGEGWNGWNDFLGTSNKFKPLPYNDARKIVRAVGLKNSKEFFKWRKHRPNGVPGSPWYIYEKTGEWKGWGDWLGTKERGFKKTYRTFVEAKNFVHGLKLKGLKEWTQWANSENKPDDIPISPRYFYKNEWDSWGDWLGSGVISSSKRVFVDYEQAKQEVRAAGITTTTMYYKWDKPKHIPACPQQVYPEWKSWPAFLRD